jgi:large subunit ribosomal protein L35Ae
MSQPVYARIVNYRIGPREQSSREILIQIIGTEAASQPGKFIGKKVVWKNATAKLMGQVVGLHGSNGILKAKFKKGVPGQALGSTIELISS